MKRRVTATMLAIALCCASACTKKTATPGESLNIVQAKTERVLVYVGWILQAADQLKPLLASKPELLAKLESIRAGFVSVQSAATPLFDFAKSVAVLDAANKDGLRSRLAAVQSAFDALNHPVQEMAVLIAKLFPNTNVESLHNKIDMAFGLIDGVLAVIGTYLR